MGTAQRWESLKGRGQEWGGLESRSPLSPMPGQFRILRNLYVSSDGTELRRIPGWRPVGHLSTYDTLTVNSVTVGAATSIQFSAAHKMPNGAKLRISGNTSDTDINGTWEVTVTAPDTVTIPVTSSGTTQTDGTFLASRSGRVHRLRQIENRFSIVGEEIYGDSSGGLASGHTAWTHVGKPDVTTPPTSFTAWRSAGLDRFFNGAASYGLVNVREVLRKSRVEVGEGRLLIAAPGHGNMYEADFYANDATSTQTQIHCLGVPKGVVSRSTSVVGSGSLTGTYYVAVAYIKDDSDEIGLMSEPLEVVCASEDISVVAATPWEMMNDMPDNCQIALFVGTEPSAMNLVQVIGVAPALGTTSSFSNVTSTASVGFRALQSEQMPMGAGDLAYTRGFGCYGGHLTRQYAMTGERITAVAPTKVVRFTSGPVLAGGHRLPSSYQGIRYWNPPGNPNWVELDKLTYLTAGTNNREWETRVSTLMTATSTAGKALLPAGRVQISEQGFPQVTPGTSQIPVDLLRGNDIEAISRINSAFVLCSSKETYVLQFGRSPVGSEPYLISDQHGAVSPIAELDNACAWMSDRGPVLCTGSSVQWIGEPVEPIFRTAMRDSEGLMPHSVVGYDSTRKLIYFGLRFDRVTTDYFDAADDNAKSKIGCDAFLIYSIDTGAWSFWDVPMHLGGIYDMHPMVCSDGVERLCFLAGDQFDVKAYAFDDAYSDTMDTSSLITSVLATGADGPAKFSFVGSGAIGTGTAARVGMGFMVTDSTGEILRGYGVIKSIVSATEVEFGALPSDVDAIFPSATIPGFPIALSPGDTIYIGVIHSRLRTLLFQGSGDLKGEGKLAGIATRHSFPTEDTATNFFQVDLEEDDDVTLTRLGPKKMGTKRVYLAKGDRRGQELSLIADLVGTAPTRLKDVFFERGPGA